MSASDIRVGDLVKATRKGRPEEYLVYRVKHVGTQWVDGEDRIADRRLHDFQVLDRPLPPIDEELHNEVTAIWRNPRHATVAEALTAIIHHVTEHNNKESK